jgi:hypothetical protein
MAPMDVTAKAQPGNARSTTHVKISLFELHRRRGM